MAVGDAITPATAGDVPVGGVVIQVTAGGHHTCALMDTGRVRCWGLGTSGQLGYGSSHSVGIWDTPAEAGDIELF
jgi:alpha-tubulin suppressor-like RCC1 family protein